MTSAGLGPSTVSREFILPSLDSIRGTVAPQFRQTYSLTQMVPHQSLRTVFLVPCNRRSLVRHLGLQTGPTRSRTGEYR